MLNTLRAGFRQREERVRVVVPCRLNLGGRWTDACIHNVSSRGLLIAANDPPNVGSYVDLRRGTLVIIARVAWRQDRFFGVRTQDRISVEALIGEPRRATAPAGSSERRAAARDRADAAVARRIERHRMLSRWMQYGSFALAGLFVAGLAASHVFQLLNESMSSVRAALGG